MKKPVIIYISLFITGALCGGLAFWLSTSLYQKNHSNQATALRENSSKYAFIDPLIAVDNNASSKVFDEYEPLQNSIEKYIDQQKKQGTITEASVYFRDLQKGRWTGINEDIKYTPASLFKVVLMVGYLKEADGDPSTLSKKLVYTNAYASEVNLAETASSTLVVGQSYTIDELIRIMITQSDNGAMSTLLNNINPNSLNDVYNDLAIENPANNPINYGISAKSYSLFFRVLYNSTYLSRNNSEKALKLLSEAIFKDGLVAGVPASTTVSHKFGVNDTIAQNGIVTDYQFHDCGIIYYPQDPYILCVMTKGNDQNNLIKTIAGISNIVYRDIKAGVK